MGNKKQFQKWHLLYYALAIFDIFAILLGLLINNYVVDHFSKVVEDDKHWATHFDEYRESRRLLSEVNAPGNRVFTNNDVALESENFKKAKAALLQAINPLEKDFHSFTEDQQNALKQKYTVFKSHLEKQFRETEKIFEQYLHGYTSVAARHMAAMDNSYYKAQTTLAEIEELLGEYQLADLSRHEKLVNDLKFWKYIIALFIFLIVVVITIYGHFLGKAIKRNTEALNNEVIQRKRAEEEANSANIAKSEFISHMSHEFKTPLNAIAGFSQLLYLDDTQPLSKEQKENVKDIMDASGHLLLLIDDVLDLSVIESGKVNMSIEPVHIGDLVNTCFRLLTPLANKQNINLFVDINTPSSMSIIADKRGIKQVLFNLISNAIKYNNEHGSVTLSTWCDGEFVFIEVKDSGMGIPEEKQNAIFESFNRIGRENSEIEGTGIGLSITKKIVTEMKGEIGFQSALNSGSTFWVKVPST